MEQIYAFFQGYDAEKLIAYLAIVLLFFWPGFGIKLLNWLKEKFKLSAQMANNFVIGVLMLFAFGAMYVTGKFIEFGPITLEKIIAVGGVTYMLSQIAYKRLFPKPPPPPPPVSDDLKPLPDDEGNH